VEQVQLTDEGLLPSSPDLVRDGLKAAWKAALGIALPDGTSGDRDIISRSR
jgi:hypothetical protein